jgi:methyl-accepting chemotaxis protein
MALHIKRLTQSVAGRIALIAAGPLVGLALTVGAGLHSDQLRKASDLEYTAQQTRMGKIEAFNSQLAIISSQISGFLETRSTEVTTSVRKRLQETHKTVAAFGDIEDETIKTAWRGLVKSLNYLQNAINELDEKVAEVGRTSQEGLTSELDKRTELALALFEGAVSMDDRFRPLATAYIEFRGAELRYRWLRDPKLENRVDFMRNALITRIQRTDFDPEQAKFLKDAVEKQGEIFNAWKQSVQEEQFLRNTGVEYVGEARESAGKLRDRAQALLSAERENNAAVSAMADRMAMIAAALAAAISIALIVLIGRALSTALANLSGVMGRVANGETDAAIPSLERRDEIGAMARALQVFQNSIAERAVLAAQSERDQRDRLERAQRIEASITSFDATITHALGTLKGSAGTMDSASSALDRDSQVLVEHSGIAGRATAAASGEVNSVAASATQLTASVEEVSRQAVRSTQVANHAVDQSRRASEMMRGLMSEASRIGDVVALIRSITEQTNLLALNATIEAARAGDAGKGFAVVASEVKALASQTAHATEEIAAKISGIQNASADAGEAIGAIDKILGEMSTIASSVAAAVEEQSSAIGAISDNVNVAARNAQEGAFAIREAEERAQAGRHTAADVGKAARFVADGTRDIETQISQFLHQVRAQ